MKNKKTLFQRILPLFLAIVMCISICDMPVFAACEHDWEILDPPNDVIVPANCYQSGRAIFTCKKCGAKEEQVTAQKEHDWYSDFGDYSKDLIKAPNCGETGIRRWRCKRAKCDGYYDEILPIQGNHNWWPKGTITKQPTATSKGIYSTYCEVCKTPKEYKILLAKTGNYAAYGVKYVNVRSTAQVPSTWNNIVGKLPENTKIIVFEDEKGMLNPEFTKFFYKHDSFTTAFMMTKFVVIQTDESKAIVGKETYKITGKSTVQFTKTKATGTVTIPASIKVNGKTYKVTSVAANAMKNNKKVKKVVIGSNITKIGSGAFSGCKNLKTITIKSSKLKSVGKNAIKNINKKAKLTCPKKKKAAYKKLFKSSTGYLKTMKIK